MKELFEFMTIFDWITPVKGFIQDFVNDPTMINSWTFFVHYDQSLKAGWNGRDIEQMLNQHGVKTWGSQLTNGEYFFSVKLGQAHFAEYLLLKGGIPINERYIGAPKL